MDGLFKTGLFNVVEGIINHEILRIHRVRLVPSWLAGDSLTAINHELDTANASGQPHFL